ncbi:MAG TPA: hypothetical protein VF665_21000 [Longimicrobium sp.]|uniref:hypothetical protein n=1 Tax=Longimicrobium sp. TaxID=2029185 RepID=UPI002ED83B7A
MRSVLRAAATSVAVLLATGGCNSPLAPGDFTLDGQWEGRGFPYGLALDLNQDQDNAVSGEGELRGLRVVPITGTERADTVISTRTAVDVSGRWRYPAFRLTLSQDEFADIQLAGTFSGPDSVNVTLTGSGFNGAAITLVRAAD